MVPTITAPRSFTYAIFWRGLSKTIPRSLFLNRTETVATQGNRVGEFAIYEFIIFNSSTFLKEKSITFKIDVVSQDIPFNQNVIAFYRISPRRKWRILKRRAPHSEKNS